MPAPHHSVFYTPVAVPAAQPTASLIVIGIPSLFHSRLKSFLFCKFSLLQPFLFLIQASPYGFPTVYYYF